MTDIYLYSLTSLKDQKTNKYSDSAHKSVGNYDYTGYNDYDDNYGYRPSRDGYGSSTGGYSSGSGYGGCRGYSGGGGGGIMGGLGNGGSVGALIVGGAIVTFILYRRIQADLAAARGFDRKKKALSTSNGFFDDILFGKEKKGTKDEGRRTKDEGRRTKDEAFYKYIPPHALFIYL